MPEPKQPKYHLFERKPSTLPTAPSELQIDFTVDDISPAPMQGFLADVPREPKLVEQRQELAPRPNEQLVASYQEFQRALNLPDEAVKTIYHPACGTDISPSVAFPDSHVIYVDHMPSAVQDLTKHGYDAHCTNANEFTLSTPADVLIVVVLISLCPIILDKTKKC